MSDSEGTPLIATPGGSPPTVHRWHHRLYPNGFRRELPEIVKIAGPIFLVQLTQNFMSPVALMFCGRLGKAQLDGVAMANSMINVTGISIAVGLATACDTLFSQIYGSPFRKNLGIALQRSILVLSLFVFPCWAIHLNIENILLALGQDAVVAKLAAEYMLIFLPALLAYFIYVCLQKYLLNQNIIYPNLWIALACNIINAVLHYVLIVVLNYGIQGSAVAQVVSYVCIMLFTVLYIVISKVYEETWSGWSAECLMEWGVFVKLAGFGVALVCLEWWSFEIGVFLSGVLGTTELGAQSVIFQLVSLTYMFPLGLGIGASIRVGQFLGAGRRDEAKTSANVAITLIVVVGSVLGILMITVRNYLPLIFTNVEEVVSLAASLLPIIGFFMIFDSIGGVCNGILRGSGRQVLGAGMVAICYSIALSVAIPLMFLTPLRLTGYWWGLSIGIFTLCTSFFIIILRTNWDGQVKLARSRTRARLPVSRLSITVSITDAKYIDLEDEDLGDKFMAMSCSRLPWSIILRVFCVVTGMVAILVTGILCRLFIPVQTVDMNSPGNSTCGYNGTMCNDTLTL